MCCAGCVVSVSIRFCFSPLFLISYLSSMAPLNVVRSAAPLRPSGLRRARFATFATPEKVQSALTEALQAAEECVGDCAVEWDTVEELSAAANKTIDDQPAADSGNRISASDAAKIQMCVLLPAFLFL